MGRGEKARPPLPLSGLAETEPLPLNSAQAAAIQESLDGPPETFRPYLLQGVTGSGKTEGYLRLGEAVLRRGQAVLILVPEIALTPQTVSRFAARFGEH